MIDAGSTGSRIHIYKFHNCGPSPTFEYEVFRMIQPGLSSYVGLPTAAAESLNPLLDEAMSVVPESLRSCTPVAVKATAGLRLLGARQSDDILKAVHDHILSKYPFPFPDKDGVVIMDGKDEGVYAWITANYLLNTIRGDSPEDAPPYAVLDLGGGSTQIVFEPQFGDEKGDKGLKEGEHKYELEFGGAKRVLYQHSYLGYGLKSARESVHRVVQFMDSLRSSKDSPNDRIKMIHNPCLAQGSVKEVKLPVGDGNTETVTMTGSDIGNFEACNRILELVMAKDDVCELKPCSFNGVYQPSLLDAFPSGKILLLSYFFDRVTPLLLADSSPDHPQPPMSISTFATLAKRVCAGPTSWEQYWGTYPEVMEELEGRPEWCLDLSFQHALLVLGYEFGDDREVQLGKRIEGTELGWCLGATIAMVGGNLRCRV
jgi:guanosine-diphosphatase